jgi:hypothetical protein
MRKWLTRLASWEQGMNAKRKNSNIKRSRDSVVGIATNYGLDDGGVRVRVPVGSIIFSSPNRPDRLWGSNEIHSQSFKWIWLGVGDHVNVWMTYQHQENVCWHARCVTGRAVKCWTILHTARTCHRRVSVRREGRSSKWKTSVCTSIRCLLQCSWGRFVSPSISSFRTIFHRVQFEIATCEYIPCMDITEYYSLI